MATHKAKVTGPFPVNGVTRGGTVVLDDEQTNVSVLVAAGHVRLIQQRKKKGDH
jgi:hypothetical protein